MDPNRGYNQDSIQDLNRTLLINLIREKGTCARITLAEESGLKQGTVTYIVNDFIRWGVVREVGFLTGNKGRRAIGLSINKENFAVIGIRIARRNYSCGLFNLAGETLIIKQARIGAGLSSRKIMNDIIDMTRNLISEYADRKMLAIGVSIPGPYNIRQGRIVIMTGGLADWNQINVLQELEKAFDLPTYIQNDANAAAIAQRWYYTGTDISKDDCLVYIAVGEGVGAGICKDSEIFGGSDGMAGEIGFMLMHETGAEKGVQSWKKLEDYCSSIAFTKAVNQKLGSRGPATFEEASSLVREGEPDAVSIYQECFDYLSAGLANAIYAFNPRYLIIGDEMVHIAPELALERVRENLSRLVLPEIYKGTGISTSLTEKDSMIHGAAVTAIKNVYQNLGTIFDN